MKLDLDLIAKCKEMRKPDELLTLAVFLGAMASTETGAKLLTDASMTDWLCQKLSELENNQDEISVQVRPLE